jgi:hypothetical protein
MDGHMASSSILYGFLWTEPVVEESLRIVSLRSQNLVAPAHASIQAAIQAATRTRSMAIRARRTSSRQALRNCMVICLLGGFSKYFQRGTCQKMRKNHNTGMRIATKTPKKTCNEGHKCAVPPACQVMGISFGEGPQRRA